MSDGIDSRCRRPPGAGRGVYVGAPADTCRCGRAYLTASCGHGVWVGPNWQRARREGKRLICLDCAAAIAAEHGHLLAIYQRAAALPRIVAAPETLEPGPERPL